MPQTIQRSFTSGEIAPALRSRADMVKYATGLAVCENFFIRAQGGAYSRAGTRFIGALDDSDRKGRLIPFSFNTEQTYVLVFEHLKMRVVKNGGLVIDGAGPALFELVTPYTEDELPRLIFTQSADVMTIVHPNHDPANLSRLADDDWTLVTNSYAPTVAPPTYQTSDVYTITGITNANPAVATITAAVNLQSGNSITIAGVTGMTNVNGIFVRVNKLTATTFELLGIDSTAYPVYAAGGTATLSKAATTIGEGEGEFDRTYTYIVSTVVDGVESLPSTPVSITTDSLSTTAGVRLQWNAVADAEYYRIYKDPSVNTGIYGWIGDSVTTSFDDYNFSPITSDAPAKAREPFTGAGNKPSTVNYYQQRLVFANTTNEPQTTYTTQVNNFSSFRVSSPARSDDAVTFTIASNQVNEIRHLLSLGALILLTSGAEWKVTEGQDQVLTPATAGVRTQSYNGASWVVPVIINSTAIYVQEKGTRLRDLEYDFSSDKYTGNDLSLMSEHLFEGYQITEMAFAKEPYSILWCVRDDGVLLGLTYQREHQVYGWHKHNTLGEFESVASIAEGDRDALYVIVKRNVNGSDVRYIERMETRIIAESVDSFCVDCGLSYNGSPVTVISGLDHLEGETVSIVADGYVVEPQVVTAGVITLSIPASVVHVGLPYVPAIETLDIDVASSTETLKANMKNVNRVIIEVEKSRGLWVGPVNIDQMREVKPRFESDQYNTIALRTYKAEILIEPDWTRGGGVRIEQRSPLPLTILSVIPRFDVSD